MALASIPIRTGRLIRPASGIQEEMKARGEFL